MLDTEVTLARGDGANDESAVRPRNRSVRQTFNADIDAGQDGARLCVDDFADDAASGLRLCARGENKQGQNYKCDAASMGRMRIQARLLPEVDSVKTISPAPS